MIELASLVAYLDDYLEIDEPPDSPGAENGLQVENSGKVDSIVACTDACLETISAAAERGANLMLVHHGLFWGKGITPLTGRRYDRIRLLLEADIALYSAHIPLDIHPEVGNNAELARLLGVRVSERFGDYDGCKIGVAGDLEIRRDELAARLEELLDHQPRVLAGGGERCRRRCVAAFCRERAALRPHCPPVSRRGIRRLVARRSRPPRMVLDRLVQLR